MSWRFTSQRRFRVFSQSRPLKMHRRRCRSLKCKTWAPNQEIAKRMKKRTDRLSILITAKLIDLHLLVERRKICLLALLSQSPLRKILMSKSHLLSNPKSWSKMKLRIQTETPSKGSMKALFRSSQVLQTMMSSIWTSKPLQIWLESRSMRLSSQERVVDSSSLRPTSESLHRVQANVAMWSSLPIAREVSIRCLVIANAAKDPSRWTLNRAQSKNSHFSRMMKINRMRLSKSWELFLR